MYVRMRAFMIALVLVPAGVAAGDEPAPYCAGEYADDLARLAPAARDMEREAYSFCVRNTVTYECLSYGDDASVRRTRKKAVIHGTAFAYRLQRETGETLLMTNQHVSDWPAVTDEAHPVDGVPLGCKRLSESLRIVDSENDDYDRDDIALTKVVSDAQLDAAILKAKAILPLMPWKIGKSAAVRERNVVEVRGFPLGAFRATNVGKVISPHDHDDQGDWNHDDFVIDALLSAGNSGSPVLAVSCKTGELELVGIYHAGYVQGSALNVVVGIDQLRDLMTTFKRAPRGRGEALAALDAAARAELGRELALPGVDPFFPLGALVARVRPRSDGALVFEVFSRDFPFQTVPMFAYEDAPSDAGFGEPGRLWFGGLRGLRRIERGELDADALAQEARLIDALRRDAVAFFGFRTAGPGLGTRADFEQKARQSRTLRRTVQARHDMVSIAGELADRWAPHDGDAVQSVTDLLQVPPASRLATAPPASTAVAPMPAPIGAAPGASLPSPSVGSR
jgi:serine protease Do